MAPRPTSIRRALCSPQPAPVSRGIQATIEQKALKAPFSGVIGIPRIDVGQYLQPGTVIASFQDLSSMKVDFTVPEQRASEIKLGQEVRVGIDREQSPLQGPRHRQGSARRSEDTAGRGPGHRRKQQGRERSFRVSSSMWRRSCRQQPNVMTVPQTAVIASLYGDYVFTIDEEAA